MNNPIFKLEKVIHGRSDDEMQDFEGPLDLILYLLGKNKMEIQDISISKILDQYLEWLETRKKMDLEVASEFVSMASHLMYIKTRMLLSIEDAEAQTEMDALIQSLEERRRSESYGKIKELVRCLELREEFGRCIETRPPETMGRGKIFEYRQERSDLLGAIAQMQERVERRLPPPQSAFREIIRHEPYPVEEKAQRIVKQLKRGGVTPFLSLFRGSRTRSELVATFLAVLELCRACVIRLTESGNEYIVRQEKELPEKLSL